MSSGGVWSVAGHWLKNIKAPCTCGQLERVAVCAVFNYWSSANSMQKNWTREACILCLQGDTTAATIKV